MKYSRVCIEAIETLLPQDYLTSTEIEARLDPLYERLNLPTGRIETMTGVLQRGLWPRDTLPSDISVQTVENLLRRTNVPRAQIGAFIHGSVCRDYQEPATACDAHRRLYLAQDAVIFDVSNACLGLLTGMIMIANMIELGQIKAGIVVGTETSRVLVETTIKELNANTSHTRQTIKDAFASLTIGSGSAAILLTDVSISETQNRLLGATVRANSQESALCRSQVDVSVGGKASGQTMKTDSGRLLVEGVALAKRAFEDFKEEFQLAPEDFSRLFCHQVGVAHERLLFQELGLDPDKNFGTFPYLGNTGSVALPTAAALGIDSGVVHNGDLLGFFGIGSGINVVLAAIQWNKTLPSRFPLPDDVLTRFRQLNNC
ncbi:MAG: 3-oxoacyl-ACP synthase III [Planctomycetia bacterium]|nr:3-oxoacyl-ACP synthase III [Planctomycetia bacterium]